MKYMRYILPAICGVIILLMAISIPFTLTRLTDLNQKCTAAGGIPYKPRDENFICIKKDSLIEIK